MSETETGVDKQIIEIINKALEKIGFSLAPAHKVNLERPADMSHGDYSTNIALAYAKEAKLNPRELADKIVAELQSVSKDNSPLASKKKSDAEDFVSKIEVAGPGFINFTLNKKYYVNEVARLAELNRSGEPAKSQTALIHSAKYSGQKVLVEYTDPNAFKVFHIGHLMANAIGESIARVLGATGAKVIRMCYPSDMGLHIAKAVWAINKHIEQNGAKSEVVVPAENTPIAERTDFLGKMYVYGHSQYEAAQKVGNDSGAVSEINTVNKKLFDKSDPALNSIYEMGRRWSLEHFELLYQKLGTKFDQYIFESEVAQEGKDIVTRLAAASKIFEQSEGAIVFKGEPYGLHTRVFVNSQGIPTYEAKDIALNTRKFSTMPDLAESIIVTANEQNEYFKVVRQALTLIDTNVGERTKHIGHGMLRLSSGKMSSRTGNVITGESLIADMEAMVLDKMSDREFSAADKTAIASTVAVGAIKYSILKQASGSDIVYDAERSVSFEGDSGPYLQYACVRARAVLAKANSGASDDFTFTADEGEIPLEIERLLARFNETISRSLADYSAHYIAIYLTELAGSFNAFYANNKILDAGDATAYRLAITGAFANVMEQGLHLLGIKVPEKM